MVNGASVGLGLYTFTLTWSFWRSKLNCSCYVFKLSIKIIRINESMDNIKILEAATNQAYLPQENTLNILMKKYFKTIEK